MSFSRLNPSGWADDDVITPAQINGIDLNASRAVDGYAGGEYAGAVTWDGVQTFTSNPVLAAGVDVDFDADRQVWRRVPLSAILKDTVSGTISIGLGATLALASNAYFDISALLVSGASLIGARLGYIGAAGHSALPSVMPYVRIVRVVEGVVADLGSASDSSVDVAAFQVSHPIVLTLGTPEVVATSSAEDTMYALLVSSEAGTNALDGAKLWSIAVGFTLPGIRL